VVTVLGMLPNLFVQKKHRYCVACEKVRVCERDYFNWFLLGPLLLASGYTAIYAMAVVPEGEWIALFFGMPFWLLTAGYIWMVTSRPFACTECLGKETYTRPPADWARKRKPKNQV
jgi:hypothetical protein